MHESRISQNSRIGRSVDLVNTAPLGWPPTTLDGMAGNRSTDKLQQSSHERRLKAVNDSIRAERIRAEERRAGRRRADIIESGTPEERAALRAEYDAEMQAYLARRREEKAAEERARLEERAQDDIYLALELETGRKWSYGEPPPQVVYTPRWLWFKFRDEPERWG